MMRILFLLLPLTLGLSACGTFDGPRWDGPPQMLPTGAADDEWLR
jgi:hypothetical protein